MGSKSYPFFMNLGKYIAQFLLEDNFLTEYSQGTINKLTTKFKQENPSLSDNEIKTYINRFDSIKGNLPIDKRDITKYSWNELEQVIISNQSKRIKAGKINDGEPKDANLVYNKDNLRIYVGKTKQACIKYGNGYSFCISARGEDNMYGEYRFMQQGTPYFIFDDSKSSERDEDGKFKDPNHLLVIFYHEENDEGPDQYSVTDANNIDTDYFNNWDEVIQYFPGQPKLKNLKNIIKSIELDQKEKLEYLLELRANNEIHDLNYVKYKNKDDFNYKIRANEYYRINDINQADRYIDKILNNQLTPYSFDAILISDDDRGKYVADMTSQNLLVQPGNLESAYKEFIKNSIADLAMNGYSPDLKTIEDEWEIKYEKLNTDNEDYITYLNDIKQVVDKYRKGLAKVKLMKENLNKPQRLNESETGTIQEFIKFACKNLEIQKVPRNLTLSYDTNAARKKRSFGYFDPNNSKIWVYVGNRNMGDILRTLAHELVHHKQNLDGRISYESGKTGSDIENEANAKAGILLRDFGKQHEEIYQ
jgi:hypothetical protein